MSDLGILPDRERRPAGHRAARAQKKQRRGPGCFFLLLIVAAVCVGGYLGVSKLVGAAGDFLGGPEDYSGDGTGSVVIEVRKGDTVAAIGRELKAKGVVASVDAFLEAASGAPEMNQVQPGFYQLKKEMAARSAVTTLISPDSRVDASISVPEGARVDQVVAQIVKRTEFSKKDVMAALEDPKLGLPAAADGDPQGYLFPATYTVAPDATPLSLLQQMVKKAVEMESDLDLEGRAAALGITPHEALTIASIVEAESGRAKDAPKVARVIYNRLDVGMALQMDSTVHFVSGKDGSVWTDSTDRDSDSPYNTYKVVGLPPGPIGNPGEAALEATLNPADGDWLYFVAVDLDTGETKFAPSLEEHNRNIAELREFCTTSEKC
ncbi:endolytic transglycosylase MltG [Mumia sp. zg.B53]|uniref:endolytic transglycosylase MltG n=1 Tax=unclassified Mumia TaxID=2621872 RepID=UPI001C6F3A89|nr:MULTISPECIES: endolytic transglycosylase MltG [unclassified Mumia]MBW9211666.1 endolytic transglycosylase MltG [Mumia sp. zg.B21]MBW9216826.1 endolytic transglycosylase MltG [Mumia sp. zg.B53]MDD9348410.1 endolytic transglycosylase MltG [Mumia sp.]